MFNRSVLKSRAKSVLSGTYWYSFAVCLILSLLGGYAGNNGGGIPFTFTLKLNNQNFSDLWENQSFSIFGTNTSFSNGFSAFWGIFAGVMVLIFMFVFAAAICFRAFLVNPLIVGKSSFFLGGRMGKKDISGMFSAFKGGNYIKTVKTVFMRDLVVWLWSLLIIPGIYFGFAYCLVPYICAENPGIDAKKARELSKRITEGSKFDIFVFNLSFIGWYLLGGLVVIGALFVNPYYEASFAELYVELRDSAIRRSVVSYTELTSSAS